MHLVPGEAGSSQIIISLSSEEALILLQPQKMVRTTLDRCPDLGASARFLTLSESGAGMLVVMPRLAGPVLLAASDSHALERELKKLIFDALAPAERPIFSVRALPNSSPA